MLRPALRMLALCLGGLVTSAHAQETAPRDLPEIGQRWHYRTVDLLTNEVTSEGSLKLVSISNQEMLFSRQIDSKKRSLIYTDLEFNTVDNGIWRYEPSLKLQPFPLRVGENWHANYVATQLKTGAINSCQIVGKVTGTETVTVAGSSYSTIVSESELECRTNNENNNVFLSTHKIFYSPEIKNRVRMEHTLKVSGRVRTKTVTELMEFSRNN